MKELSAELRKAQEYENKALKEENENKFPVFHLKVPTGWMNDPNGFSVYKGEYHLLFQGLGIHALGACEKSGPHSLGIFTGGACSRSAI